MNGNIQLLAFTLDDQRFGLPLAQVHRVIRAVDCTPLPSAPRSVAGVIDVAGSILPVLDVRDRFGFTTRPIGLDDQFIIARTLRRTVALIVDSTSGVITRPAQDVVLLSAQIAPSAQIAGVIQLQDGLLLIHDLERFLSAREDIELESALADAP